MTHDLTKLETVVSGLDHPEGIAWGVDGNLYAGGEAGQVYRIVPGSKQVETIANTGGFALGIAIDVANNLYICDMGVHAVVKVTPAGACSTYSSGPATNPLRIPNYPVFDAQGNLYVSDSRDWNKQNGLIYKIRPGGIAEEWSRAAPGYTNGMALSPDGKWLYVVESIPAQITRIAIQAEGSAGEAQTVVKLGNEVPDGICFGANGELFIALYSPDRIYQFSPSGQLTILFDDWSRIFLNAPTNLAFAGAGLDRLTIASLGGYAITWADIGVKGSPVHYPKL